MYTNGKLGPGNDLAAPIPETATSARCSDISMTTMGKKKYLTDEDTAAKEEGRINEDLLQLARRLTSQSQGALGSLFSVPADGTLNPNSTEFNARKWAKAFYEIKKNILEGNPPKTTGVAFRNLNTYGFSSATDFQKSVGNIFLDAGSIFQKFFRENQQCVDILRNLEGAVNNGEMIAVLGPPGSGCSAFLKTIAGDTHGFHVGKYATINYQCIHPKQMRIAFRSEAIYTAEIDQHFP